MSLDQLFHKAGIKVMLSGGQQMIYCSLPSSRPKGKLDFIDHVVGNQPDDEMVPVVDW